MHYIKLTGRPVETLLQQTLHAHEVVVSLLQSPNLAQTLLALYDDDVRREAAKNTMDAAYTAGIAMPDGARPYIHEFADGWEAEVHIPQGRTLIIVGYSSLRGFYIK